MVFNANEDEEADVTVVEWREGQAGRSSKRKKREEESPQAADKRPIKRLAGDTTHIMLEKVLKASKRLNELVNKSTNTKTEIKEAITALRYNIDRLATDINKRKDEEKSKNKDQGTQVGDRKPETREIGIQVNNMAMDIEKEIGNNQNFEDVDALLNHDWPEDVYVRTKEVVDYPIKRDKDKDLVLLVDPGGGEKGLGKIIIERCPEAWDLINPDQEEVKYLNNITKTITSDGVSEEKSKYIFVIPHNVQEEPNNFEKIYNKVVQLRDQIIKENRRKVVFAAAEGINRSACRRILECVFRKTSVDLECRVPNGAQRVRQDGGGESQGSRSSVLTIKKEGQTYAELLKTIKDKVNIEKMGINIKKIRESGTENIQLVLNEGKEKTMHLAKEITTHCKDVNVITRTFGTTLYVLGMERTTTAEEVTNALTRSPVRKCKEQGTGTEGAGAIKECELFKRVRSASLTSLKGPKKRCREMDEAQEFKDKFDKINETVNRLEAILSQTPNTKAEMREAIKVLVMQVKGLNGSIPDWEELRNTKERKLPEKTTRSIGVQAELTERIEEIEEEKKEVNNMVNKIFEEEGNDKERLLNTIDVTWDEKRFRKTKVKKVDQDNISFKSGSTIAIIIDPEYKKRDQTDIGYSNKIPGLNKLIEEGLTMGEIEYVQTQLEVTSKKETEVTKSRTIALPISMDKSGFTDAGAVYDMGIKLSEEPIIEGVEEISLIVAGKMDMNYVRKIVEYIFRWKKVDIEIIKYEKGAGRRGSLARRPSIKLPAIMGGREQRGEGTGTEKIIVKSEKGTYLDALKAIKQKVDPRELGVDIKAVQKTAKGDLLLEVRGDRAIADRFKEAIKQNVQNKVEMVNRTKTIHISDIDGDVTGEQSPPVIRKTGLEEFIATGRTTRSCSVGGTPSKRKQDDRTVDLEEFRSYFSRIVVNAEQLIRLTVEHHNYTQADIRDKIKELKKHTDSAQKKLSNLSEDVVTQEEKKKRMEPATRTIGTQTYLSGNEDEETREAKEISEQLDRIESFEELGGILETQWPEKVYRNTKEVEINTDAYRANNTLLVVGSDKGADEISINEMERTFPGLTEILDSNEGTLDKMNNTQKISSRAGDRTIDKNIFILPMETTEAVTESESKNAITQMTTFKEIGITRSPVRKCKEQGTGTEGAGAIKECELFKRVRSASLTSLKGPKKRCREMDEAQEFKDKFDKINETVNRLEAILSQTPNTKAEMREAIKVLVMQVKGLNGSIPDWEELRNTKERKLPEKTTRSIGVQAELMERIEEIEEEKKEVNNMVNKIFEEEGNDKERLLNTIDVTWDEKRFRKTKVKKVDQDNISFKSGSTIAIIIDPEYKKRDQTDIGYSNKIPGLNKLIEEGLTMGEIEYVQTQLEVTSKKETEVTKSRTIALPISMDKSGFTDAGAVYDMGIKLSEEPIIEGVEEISLIVAGKMDMNYVRKIVEYIFRWKKVDIEIIKYEKGAGRRGSLARRPSIKLPAIMGGREQRGEGTGTEKIIVKSEKGTYLDALKAIKQKVDPRELGVDIKAVQKTAKGDLLLEVRGDRAIADRFKEAIKQNVQNKVEMVNRTKTIHISDIDGDVTGEQLESAIRQIDEDIQEHKDMECERQGEEKSDIDQGKNEQPVNKSVI
ncbi:unnamed protein product [Phyllotreta striolata]|uniref:Uncharacterized protein n=1 Tax=Phyllotreta striolata TaxID=444603 RepID=A0A9P0DWV6_PHYSR|nr:unnamed protein product [Phyllotreta striolata]